MNEGNKTSSFDMGNYYAEGLAWGLNYNLILIFISGRGLGIYLVSTGGLVTGGRPSR
jgi:hypothetical protein